MEIELISDIAYAPIHKVTSFQQQGHKVSVTAEWTKIDMRIASGEFSSASRQNSPGASHVTNLSLVLKIPQSIGFSIIKIALCSGRVLILGTPHIPVFPTKNSSLSLTTITISHTSIDPPLELIP